MVVCVCFKILLLLLSLLKALKHPWIVNNDTDEHLVSAHERFKTKAEAVNKERLTRSNSVTRGGIMSFLFRGRQSVHSNNESDPASVDDAEANAVRNHRTNA